MFRASVSAKTVVRTCKDLIDFLLHGGVVKSITSSGQESISMIIEGLLPLEHGEGA